MGEDSCSSQTIEEGSESILLVATLQSPKALKQCYQQKVEKCNRLSSGPAHTQLSHMRKCNRLSCSVRESLGTRLHMHNNGILRSKTNA